MIRKVRVSLAGLMHIVLIAAVGFAALRTATTNALAGVILLTTCAVLMMAVVSAACRGSKERAWWLGFALFGWGYLALAHWFSSSRSPLPTILLVDFMASRFGLEVDISARLPWEGLASLPPTIRIAHCLWALLFAFLGGILASVLVAIPVTRAEASVVAPSPEGEPAVKWWRRTAFAGLAGCVLVSVTAVAARWTAPGVWAGAAFLLTCGLLGLAALAALYSRGRSREAWLGAALFGFGYLLLTFGRSEGSLATPHLPTEQLLNSVFRPSSPPIAPEFPDSADTISVRTRRFLRRLDQPIPMHFPTETPLVDVLKYIRTATKDTNFPGLPIYVDPSGLEDSGRNLQSTVSLDVDAIPVKDALRLCLKQLGLGFSARSGFIMISAEEYATIPVFEDPIQIAGHSLLALIAAGLGALAVSFVSDRRRGPHARDRHTP